MINKLLNDGALIDDPKDIANFMNDHFYEIGEKLQNEIPNLGDNFLNYLPDRVDNSLFLNPTSENELLKEISKLNPKKSCGADNIGAKVLQLCPRIYLGLLLDETLNWGDHVNSLCSSLLKYFGIFNQIKNKVNVKIARQIYFAFIYSRIKYGIEVYGHCSATNLNKIQILQNKLMKMLLNMDRLTPTNTLHHNLNILKVQDVFNCNLVNFVNDILIKRCPDVFFEYFVLKQNTYDLRTKGQVVVPPARIHFGDRQVRIKGA